jgi:hypothetical protein
VPKAVLYLMVAISGSALLVVMLFAMRMFEDYYVNLGFELGSETLSMALLSTLLLLAVIGAPGGWAAIQLLDAQQREKLASDPDAARDN